MIIFAEKLASQGVLPERAHAPEKLIVIRQIGRTSDRQSFLGDALLDPDLSVHPVVNVAHKRPIRPPATHQVA